ncbi:LPS-induced tumor necrosis factor alpha factor [Penicillium pulvis]|uniref:LPS-induced tumor necrosis factor alpha factor n=1 Tax=Penicillium pulvis TaxID=1562058 RepID=UPI002548F5BE|nr:LPS-induced tumor necrosis factor alpha factor [Penicillium pulvis]KAJ5802711.1 LPS-induced tumor necrosis factor alpha factor [Penicillium pulvis]
MAERPDSEGLIPVETLEHHLISPISPLNSSERASTNSAPLLDPISPPPLPAYERTRPEDAPMPVDTPQTHGKDYIGQAPSEFQPAFAGQHPMNSVEEEKTYPGQPAPSYIQPPPLGPPPQQQPQPYYAPAGQSSSYASAVPLHALRQAPCPVDCPACGQRELTRTQPVSGSTTQ